MAAGRRNKALEWQFPAGDHFCARGGQMLENSRDGRKIPCDSFVISCFHACPGYSKEVPMALEAHIRELSDRHARLDQTIQQVQRSPASDPVEIATLKRKKLRLKEELEALRRQ
jgi:hypothetical protein